MAWMSPEAVGRQLKPVTYFSERNKKLLLVFRSVGDCHGAIE